MGKRDHVLRCSEEDLSKDLTGKIYIVTGANSGVGLETTRQLISQKAHVIMACRRPGAADEEAKSFTEANLPGTHESMKCDLADLESVRSFCTEFLKTHDRLDGLVCNAGMVNWGEKKTTKDGFETTIGISYFGHFLMTELLLDILKKSAPSRTCIVSSVVHAGSPKSRPDIDLTDLNWETRKFDHQPAYNEAKVATTLYALELGDRLKGTGVSTASIHPGWARSNLAAGAGWFISTLLTVFKPFYYHMTDSSEESAQTTLHVMLNDEAPKHNGAYFSQHSYLYSDEECKKGGWPMVSPNPNARDLDKARELVKVTRDLVGLK
eukprot:CAMPEP_0194046308 /NCGR_PEP_ID=MMETSP0009_2-20130614/20494_1 /TAXON_ID=210454 /ORGANISM="Grammatophora oceanica, Strain CCMP 410" /LENGTH=322 /DNA_ID=CAMNT_0038691539 /DNA_START=250 /DNA_END=1218 /DNA_ORIENTATION=+